MTSVAVTIWLVGLEQSIDSNIFARSKVLCSERKQQIGCNPSQCLWRCHHKNKLVEQASLKLWILIYFQWKIIVSSIHRVAAVSCSSNGAWVGGVKKWFWMTG